MSFQKTFGEFDVTVSDPYPCWVRIVHEFSDGYVQFEHGQLDDLVYALTQAQVHITAALAKARGEQ